MNFLFGCSHKNTSFPITLRSKSGYASSEDTHICCLDCGQEFPYSWEEMRVVRGKRTKAGSVAVSSENAVLHELAPE